MLNDNHTTLRPLQKLKKISKLTEVEREKNKKISKKRCIGLQLGGLPARFPACGAYSLERAYRAWVTTAIKDIWDTMC